MTEAEWLATTEPSKLLKYLYGKATDRKVALVACATCRSVWDSLHDERSRNAIELTEGLVDGVVSPSDHERACDAAAAAMEEIEEKRTRQDQTGEHEADALGAAERAHEAAVRSWEYVFNTAQENPDVFNLIIIMRDIFGNPFRPIALDPSWLSSTVLALAKGIYADRAFDRLPILADALQDAGCQNPEILAHCSGEGPHTRGCWVVDLLLNRE